ncbi:hypothetical protein AOLI_G00039370 [Acnodon oligacanthus]
MKARWERWSVPDGVEKDGAAGGSQQNIDNLLQLEALLEAQSVQVLMVSYGSLEGAEFWLAQTDCEFDIVFDPERKVYQAFSLGSSFAKVMNFSNLLCYSEYHVTKRSFPQVPPQFIHDLFSDGW